MPPQTLPKVSQTIENRYIDKADLVPLLRQLFSNEFIVEDLDEHFRLQIPRQLTESAPERDNIIDESFKEMIADILISTSSMEEIRDKINSLRRENFEGKSYVPEPALHNVLSESAVTQVLQSCTIPQQLSDVAKVVTRGARKILAILLLDGHVDYIMSFISTDQYQESNLDHRLPFNLSDLEKLLHRNPVHAKLFFDRQWEFISPVFSESVLRRQLDKHTILPVIDEKYISKGSFGTVWELHLDQELNLFGSEHSTVVRKELMPDRNDFQEELDSLSSVKLLRHPNILRLLGSYTFREKHNFIFPQARGGSLADFFKNKRPVLFKEDSTLLVALAKLASAVAEVHEFHVEALSLSKIGFHHDLKPDNILVDDNNFILADFGLARFKDHNEGSATEFKIGKGCCLAPECQDIDGNFEHHDISRSSDVWSFGCILADFATYLVSGPSSVSEFHKRRRYQTGNQIYYYFHHGSLPSPAVEEWLAQLEETGSTVVGFLIDLVRSILQMTPSTRPLAKEVAEQLRFIALLSLFLECFQRFGDLTRLELNKEGSIDPAIERLRLSSWGRSLGMDSDKEGSSSTPKLDLGFNGFHSAVEVLQEIRLELDSISSQSPHNKARILMPLRHLNTSLLALLPQQEQNRAMEYLEQRVIETDNLRTLSMLQQGHQGGLIQQLAIAKRSTLRTEHGIASEERTLQLINKPELHQFNGMSRSLGHHIIGTIQALDIASSIPVLIEYKSYTDPLLRQQLFVRMDGISQISNSLSDPDQMRILRCRGYFHDESKSAFGLVYDFPKFAQPTRPPFVDMCLSLRKILDDQQRDQTPTLGQRFKLAYDLSSAICNFQKVGWFHKGISSSNILFFLRKPKVVDTSCMNPYVVGFRHSRPHDVVTFTEGPASGKTDIDDRSYQHPEYLSQNIGYSFKHEYYSLGLVLLEIGLWTPMVKMGRGLVEMDAYMRRKRLLEDVVPRLAQKMGIVYQNVVQVLLESEVHGEQEAQRWFHSVVVSELFRLSTLIL